MSDRANVQDDAQTQSDRAYQNLRSAIIRCELDPGSRLRVEELTRRFGVSSSPLREALSRLAGQGLVYAVDKRGFRVAPLTVEGVRELTRVRVLIESETLFDAMEHGGDGWEAAIVAAAHHLSLSERRLGSEPGTLDDDWSARHRAFHMTLYDGAQSSLLRRMVGDLFDAGERYRRYSSRYRKVSRDKNHEHQELMSLVLSRSKKKAVDFLTAHIRSTERNVTQALESTAAKAVVSTLTRRATRG